MINTAAKNEMSGMPMMFIGHGSPMNAVADNPYTRTLRDIGRRLPRPRAILCISAHWMTNGTWITAMERPKTIHDFRGFPDELFEIQYPAPGSPDIARHIQSSIKSTGIHLDEDSWGLDHGTWSILRHIYPNAEFPVLQLSLDVKQPVTYHIAIAKELASLRKERILIIGSGNLVHNLRAIAWEADAKPHDWAVEFDEWVKEKLLKRDFNAVLYHFHDLPSGKLSIPTLEHYLPIHYILGGADPTEELKFEYEEIQNASISMRSLSLTPK